MTIPTSCLPQMVPIPGGVFQGRTIEPFSLGLTPVTNADYEAHVQQHRGNPFVLLETAPGGTTSIVARGNDPAALLGNPAQAYRKKLAVHEPLMIGALTLFELLPPDPFARPNEPVVRVSWFHAFEYCASNGFALPSDEQWAYASEGRHAFEIPDLGGQVWEWTERDAGQRFPYGLWRWFQSLPATGRRVGRRPDLLSNMGGFRVAKAMPQ